MDPKKILDSKDETYQLLADRFSRAELEARLKKSKLNEQQMYTLFEDTMGLVPSVVESIQKTMTEAGCAPNDIAKVFQLITNKNGLNPQKFNFLPAPIKQSILEKAKLINNLIVNPKKATGYSDPIMDPITGQPQLIRHILYKTEIEKLIGGLGKSPENESEKLELENEVVDLLTDSMQRVANQYKNSNLNSEARHEEEREMPVELEYSPEIPNQEIDINVDNEPMMNIDDSALGLDQIDLDPQSALVRIRTTMVLTYSGHFAHLEDEMLEYLAMQTAMLHAMAVDRVLEYNGTLDDNFAMDMGTALSKSLSEFQEATMGQTTLNAYLYCNQKVTFFAGRSETNERSVNAARTHQIEPSQHGGSKRDPEAHPSHVEDSRYLNQI